MRFFYFQVFSGCPEYRCILFANQRRKNIYIPYTVGAQVYLKISLKLLEMKHHENLGWKQVL